MKNKKKELFILEILSIVCMVLPLIILFVVKREEFLVNASPLHLSIGGITALLFAFMMVKNKMDFTGQRVLKFLLFFILCYIFEPFLSSLKIISFSALIGQILNAILFEYKIKNLRKTIDAMYISDAIKGN